ncbi:tRNA (N(6)-L-threonylcarbamoyladenosine(37)-C(2))-methylthiotransferase MtaB [Bartonella sp. CB169]|uniref:tRNA (N(6)-L-threonylcarbamoyladenosine(37)-C(2))- methylthiotransferase MtaB n=1 Tax=Bartonella sp. CB169 TaxID=3112257 RepID=UPI00300E6648
MAIEIVTLGCRLNSYESEIIRKKTASSGLDKLKDGAIIFNTCAVTAEAVRQAKQAIRRARRENPHARIIVTGCAAQTEAQNFASMTEVDLVLGNEDKLHAHSYRQLPDFGINHSEKVLINDIMEVKKIAPHIVSAMKERTRAFVQVQNGCDHRCTFCIIPYGRGPSRSVPMGAVVEQIKKLTGNGIQEIVLTGVDLTSYGHDLPGKATLGKLTSAILRHIPDLPRLRLSSIDSIETDEELINLLAYEKRIMPHLHLSLQAGDNMILKRMKRRHLREHAIQFCQDLRAKRPTIVYGADLIAGFPTETEEMFQNSLSLIDECNLTHLHIFPFSPREGTPAARMPQINRRIIKMRAEKLRKAGKEAYQKHLAHLQNSQQKVLIEKNEIGRTEDYTLVQIKGAKDGTIVQALIVDHDGDKLIAVPQKLNAA